jgi:hypothetical protein
MMSISYAEPEGIATRFAGCGKMTLASAFEAPRLPSRFVRGHETLDLDRRTDARHNKSLIGRILIARRRDATDVAIVTSFGPCTLTGFKVITEEVRSSPRRS